MMAERTTQTYKATMQDVAREAGVSIATVSYVLNNRTGDVGAAMRERVLQTVRRLRYQPRAGLRRGQRGAHTVGFLMQNAGLQSLVRHPYAMFLLDGVLSVATPNHINVLLFSVPTWEDAHQCVRAHIDDRCDGLIVGMGSVRGRALWDVLLERGIPFVAINDGASEGRVDSVDVDHVGAAEHITAYLIARGHRRIGFIGGAADNENSADRLAGYRQALTGAGIAQPPELVAAAGFWEEAGFEKARVMLDREAGRPTALFCASDQIASGAYRAARDKGLRIPADVSVTGFDDLPVAVELAPPLTTIRQPFQQMAVRAMEMLLLRIAESGEAPPHPIGEKVVFPTEFVERDSVASV